MLIFLLLKQVSMLERTSYYVIIMLCAAGLSRSTSGPRLMGRHDPTHSTYGYVATIDVCGRRTDG